MAYQPKLPKQNYNIGRQRPLQDLFLIGSAILALLFLLYWLLGLAIDKAINHLSPELEQQWFGHFATAPVHSPQQQYLQHRDHLRGFGRALVLAVLTSTLTGSSNAGQIFLPATELGQAQHSQQRELAADATALDILNCYYGHTGGAEVFFRAMLQQDSSRLPSWFDSHPKLQLRLTALNQQRQQKGYRLDTVTPLPAILQRE